jgi:hypothetical protein
VRGAIPGGFTIDDFTVDHDNRTVTCPNGLTRPIGRTGVVTFGAACANCPLRAQCTRRPRGRVPKIGAHDARQRAARRAARDALWLADYRQHRPMIERTIAWLTPGNRRLRPNTANQPVPQAKHTSQRRYARPLTHPNHYRNSEHTGPCSITKTALFSAFLELVGRGASQLIWLRPRRITASRLAAMSALLALVRSHSAADSASIANASAVADSSMR